jgi:hypothetical protein
MENLGRYLVVAGVVLLLLGGGLYFGAKVGLQLGRLPGDFRIGRDGGGFYFPLTSSIVVSLILTLILNIVLRICRK